MKANNYLLSICIPTYNRCDYLQKTLDNIIENKAFGPKIEVVISDNASNDNTQTIGEKYALKYENIFYYRNKKNILDKNYIISLKRANGKYIRLCNDTLHFKSNTLELMLHHIESNQEESPLFFIQNIPFLNKNTSITISNKTELIQNISFLITWIGNFGTWKKNIDEISYPEKYCELKLSQVDWFYQIVSNKKTKIFFGDYFESIYPNNKGGYNFFQIFITNYLYITRQHVSSLFYLEIEKYTLFRHHIIPYYYRLILNNKDKFDTSHFKNIILKHYWYYPYTYIGLTITYIYNFLKKNT